MRPPLFLNGAEGNRLLRRARPEHSCVGSPALAAADVLSAHPPPAALAPLRFPLESKKEMTAMRPPLFLNGAEGNRTLDLLNAIQALSQLSYGPVQRR